MSGGTNREGRTIPGRQCGIEHIVAVSFWLDLTQSKSIANPFAISR